MTTDRTLSRVYLAAALLAVLLLLAEPAAAQGFMDGAINFVKGSVIRSLGTLAIIGAGIVLLAMRFTVVGLVCVAVGVWIMFNADTLMGYIQT